MSNQTKNISGKCSGCLYKTHDGKLNTKCLGCKRQYYPGMEQEPYERKPDLYRTAELVS